jgi:eukaryotic-like serine/threonine-protein kinase
MRPMTADISLFRMVCAPGGARDSTEDGRAYLQKRLSLFALVCAIVSFGFWAAGLLLGFVFYPEAFSPRHLLHASCLYHEAGTLLAAAVWLATRKGRLSSVALSWIDAVGAVMLTLLFALMGAAIPASFGWVQSLLATTILLMVRAVAVPSTGLRTLVISILGAATTSVVVAVVSPGQVAYPQIVGTDHSPVQVTIYMSLWLGAAVAVSTFASRIIFGLQQAVRTARQIGQYVLKHEIGEGGMGVVYLATHAMLRRETAIKLLLPNRIAPAALARFEREVQQLARLAHPNTVAIYDYGRTPEGIFYYAMEYLDGLNLDELVTAAGPLPAARVIYILDQICGSLSEAHGMGLVHRDIKPANVILSCRGGILDAVKVLDFGLVKDVSDSTDVAVTASKSFLGTPQYASPEAIQNPEAVTAASDLYAVAAIGYYLLTGTHVFAGETFVEICAGHLYKAPEPPSQRLGWAVPQALEALILQGLAKRPEDRPASAQAFRNSLRACPETGKWTDEDALAWWQAKGRELLAKRQREGKRMRTPAEATVAVDLNAR